MVKAESTRFENPRKIREIIDIYNSLYDVVGLTTIHRAILLKRQKQDRKDVNYPALSSDHLLVAAKHEWVDNDKNIVTEYGLVAIDSLGAFLSHSLVEVGSTINRPGQRNSDVYEDHGFTTEDILVLKEESERLLEVGFPVDMDDVRFFSLI